MQAKEVHINNKVMELRHEVLWRTQVPAQAGTRPRKTLPNKIQLNRKAYSAVQGSHKIKWQEYSLKKLELELLIQQNKKKMLT